ncbi:MAG: hypothetical protein H6Q73_3897 [Firmicutes bacterium]|nr:hypothetical protein [Bacillota bacterium]
MKLYGLEPEVAGGFGENTVVSNLNNVRSKRERPIVTHLHYEFSGWLGDEILETTPCFIITESLADSIQRSELKGYTFADVETSVTEEFEELYPGRTLPKFRHIIPQGTVEVNGDNFKNWSGDDFCLSQRSILVVSEKVLAVFKKHQFDHCYIAELDDSNGQ